MLSKFLDGFHRTLGFRLTFWYSVIFIFSFFAFSVFSYLFVLSSMRDNRPAIRAELVKYVSLAERGGIEAIAAASRELPGSSRRSSFFIRVIDSNDAILFESNPRLWEKFRIAGKPDRVDPGEWHYYTSRRERDGDLLEVASARLRDQSLLQVGKSIQDREEVLEHFRDTVLIAMIPMVIFGLVGGSFLAHRALRPIRNLSVVARSIVDTGRFDARVPVRASGDELNELVVLFNRMLGKIALLIQGMKDSLDNVAHDLRTPVTRLRGVAEEALRSGSSSDSCREALADCLEESDRLMTMLDTLMDVSEAETGTMTLSLESVNLAALIDEVADLYGYVAEDKRVALSTKVPVDICLVADRTRLRQVLANLVDNAIKYTPSGGHVEIEASKNGQHAVVRVKDDGMGISIEELPRIWDRLYRGDKSRSQRGLGLGLSLVKAVVRAHHGDVEAAANPSGGALFSLTLPLTYAADAPQLSKM